MRIRTLGLFVDRLADWQYIAALFLAPRIWLTIVGLVPIAALPLAQPTWLDFLPDLRWLSIWAQWDAKHYIEIAVHGYTHVPNQVSNVPFFPLYPWLIRVVASPFGPIDEHSATLAGLLISNLALLVALYYLLKLVSRDQSRSVARRTVLYTLVFPTTLYLSSAYAESLFLATAVASVFHARRGEWYRAGLAGGLATLSRPFGLLLLAPVVIEMMRQRPGPRAQPSLALIPAGLAAFFAYLWWQFGDPFLYFKAAEIWGRGLQWPWETLVGYLRQPLQLYGYPFGYLDPISIAAMVVLIALGIRRLPWSYSAYSAAGFLLVVSSGIAWISASRHALALFPLIVVLAMMGERRPFQWAWPIGSMLLASVFTARVAAGYWVA